MRFAYADPPYLGCGKSHYGEHHPDAADYDRVETHAALIARLCAEFDGWALSCHPKSLKTMLDLCPDDVRIGAWVKPWAAWKPGARVAHCWEPVIFRGERRRERVLAGQVIRGTVRDYVSAGMTMRRGLCGAKPDRFCWWVFDLLGMEAGDDFVDLFSGSGAVGRAWEQWTRANRKTPLFQGISSDSME